MPRRRVGRIASLTAVALALVASFAPAASARTCPGKFQGGFFSDLTARNVDCATGKQVLRSWVRRSGFGSRRPASVVAVGSWRCTFITIQGVDNPYGRITCLASRGRFVRFYGVS